MHALIDQINVTYNEANQLKLKNRRNSIPLEELVARDLKK